MPDIIVYGATGFTGTLVCRQLLARGHSLAIAGRDPARLRRLADELPAPVETHAAAVHDDAALEAAFAGTRLVINCAGPFSAIGEPVVAAAIAAGCAYLDTTGEQAFMRTIYERYESRARRAGVAVCNGFAFEIALGDWAAALAAHAALAAAASDAVDDASDEESGALDEVIVAYGVSRFRPTRGTRLAMVEALTSPGCVWNRDRWDPVAPAAERRTIDFAPGLGVREAVSFPSGEVITVPRHVPAHRVQTFVSLSDAPWLARATAMVSPVLPALLRSPLGQLARARAGAGEAAPSELDRHHTLFTIVAEARRGQHVARTAVSGRDIYGVTAHILAQGADRVCRGALDAGVLAPAELIAPEAALNAVAAAADLTVERG